MANVLDIDDYDLTEALEIVSAFGVDRYGYVVTPNVDHVIRHYQDNQFRALYEQAAYVLLDSRFLAHTIGLIRRQILRVCLGSDLTTSVLRTVIKPFDIAVLVGGTPAHSRSVQLELASFFMYRAGASRALSASHTRQFSTRQRQLDNSILVT